MQATINTKSYPSRLPDCQGLKNLSCARHLERITQQGMWGELRSYGPRLALPISSSYFLNFLLYQSVTFLHENRKRLFRPFLGVLSCARAAFNATPTTHHPSSTAAAPTTMTMTMPMPELILTAAISEHSLFAPLPAGLLGECVVPWCSKTSWGANVSSKEALPGFNQVSSCPSGQNG